MILHLVNKPDALQLCMRFAGKNDVILLLEDGVTLALEGTRCAEALTHTPTQRIVAIEDDLSLRGLSGKLAAQVQAVSYSDFVALCCECDKVQSWF